MLHGNLRAVSSAVLIARHRLLASSMRVVTTLRTRQIAHRVGTTADRSASDLDLHNASDVLRSCGRRRWTCGSSWAERAPASLLEGSGTETEHTAPASAQLAVHCRRPAPAADHAAALWQLCCRIGRMATVAFQRWSLHARCHNLRRATGARRGVHTGTAQRAGDGGHVYPANGHRLWFRTRSCVRRWL